MANDLTTDVAGAFRRMPATRRLMILGLTTVAIAAVVGVGLWAAEPNWVVLYQDVSLAEAARMVDALDKAGIQNKLATDGSEVLVGREDHARARVALAKEQLPMSGRPGFELFEQKQDWGMTDFTQRITYQRALEGELARTIGSTNGVERAEVHLTIPEPGALRRLDRPAKAAVLIRMRRGMILSPKSVQGIIAIVANSVDRLSPEGIAVTDESGRLLSGAAEEGGLAGGASRRMEIQRSVEEYLAGKAETLLASVGGIGAVRVQVAAVLDFDQVDRTIESFDPDGQVLQSEGRSETEAPAEGGGAQTVINNTYQNSRRLERIVTGGSGVTRLTVAVLLDEQALADDSVSRVPAAERIANVRALVQDAIGFDSTRGDRITVSGVPFEVPVMDSVSQAPPRDIVGLIERFVRPAIGLAAIAALMLLAIRGVKAMQLAAPAATAGGRAISAAEETALPPLSPAPEAVRLKNRVVQETAERPEVMAQVVRAWMNEGGDR
ncbi:MAG: flagellar basal-body MS-ring/collar protein FliF [Gemmatimonadales bacterium]